VRSVGFQGNAGRPRSLDCFVAKARRVTGVCSADMSNSMEDLSRFQEPENAKRPIESMAETRRLSSAVLPRCFRKGIFRKGMNMRVVSGVRQLFRDPVEAYHKAVSQWYERNDPDDTPYTYVPDANWRERLGVTGDDR
jgi:hypothetical protein